MSSSRTLQKRRERRLAKASEWKRPGKSNPKKVGHGGSGMMKSKTQRNMKKLKSHVNEDKQSIGTFSMSEFFKEKNK
jgi:hypothetical protein